MTPPIDGDGRCWDEEIAVLCFVIFQEIPQEPEPLLPVKFGLLEPEVQRVGLGHL